VLFFREQRLGQLHTLPGQRLLLSLDLPTSLNKRSFVNRPLDVEIEHAFLLGFQLLQVLLDVSLFRRERRSRIILPLQCLQPPHHNLWLEQEFLERFPDRDLNPRLDNAPLRARYLRMFA